ncbi:hypothetical protein BC826DRAFT_973476 [Russula brevipes]|nr:hypothetical protein BC826DRAFT_973476 [Russula brevipes]
MVALALLAQDHTVARSPNRPSTSGRFQCLDNVGRPRSELCWIDDDPPPPVGLGLLAHNTVSPIPGAFSDATRHGARPYSVISIAGLRRLGPPDEPERPGQGARRLVLEIGERGVCLAGPQSGPLRWQCGRHWRARTSRGVSSSIHEIEATEGHGGRDRRRACLVVHRGRSSLTAQCVIHRLRPGNKSSLFAVDSFFFSFGVMANDGRSGVMPLTRPIHPDGPGTAETSQPTRDIQVVIWG